MSCFPFYFLFYLVFNSNTNTLQTCVFPPVQISNYSNLPEVILVPTSVIFTGNSVNLIQVLLKLSHIFEGSFCPGLRSCANTDILLDSSMSWNLFLQPEFRQ